MTEILNWPVDEEGNPLSVVKARVKELIPTAKFANVEIDLEIQSVVTKDVTDGDIKAALAEAYDQADEVLQAKRDPIIEELEGGNL